MEATFGHSIMNGRIGPGDFDGRPMNSSLLRVPAAILAVTFASFSSAADWPQWRGPQRDGVSRETGLLKSWPQAGPKRLWTIEGLGAGYSGPAVVGGRIFIAGSEAGNEVLIALEAATGAKLWSAVLGTRTENPWGDGPRAVPTVDGDTVYALAGTGVLAAVSAADGKVVRTWDLKTALAGELQTGFGVDWGFCDSPLIAGDRVIITPGGAAGAIAALDRKTGAVAWRAAAIKDPATYASVMPMEVGGVRQFVQILKGGIVGVAADDGRLLWRHNVPMGLAVHVGTPVIRGDSVYVSTGYAVGCRRIRVVPEAGGFRAEVVYANREMVNHHGGVVLVDDRLYGYSDNRGWLCQDFETGKTLWAEKEKLGKGCVTAADGRLYVLVERGGVVGLLEPSPAGYREHGRFTLPKLSANRRARGGVWTHPVIADGKLFLRDQELLFCFDVKADGGK
jgi:outer membrane protein assembly factor BamB